MNMSINELLSLGIGWVQRRFWLIAIPLALSVPLSIAAALLFPQKYAATTLMLMQEVTTENPFARQLRANETPADKLGALQALMFSDRNLNEVLAELHGKQILQDPKILHRSREDLKRSLSIAPSGPEFVVIRYVADNPAGMGRILNVVLARLLETLLQNNTEAPVAPEIVKSRMVERLSEMDVALSALKSSKLIQEIARSNDADKTKLESLLADVSRRHASFKAARTTASTSQVAGESRVPSAPSIGSVSAMANGLPSGTERPVTAGEADRLQQEIEFLRLLLEQPGASARVHYNASVFSLETSIDTAKKALVTWSARFGNTNSTGISFMRAPERIIVLDPPRDPDVAQVPRSRIAMIGLGSGLALAIGLGLLGEFLDRRVRTIEQLRAVTGVEVLARLPKA